MAERISHNVTPPKIGPDAHQELEALLQTLHEQGVLRFANDVVAANTDISRILVDGLSKQGSLNVLQNLSILVMTLSALPPERFYQMMFAIKEGADQIGRYHSDEERTDGEDEAPGIRGVYKMLHDEELWHALQPLLAGLKAFSEGLDKPVEKPVTAFTGKPTEGA